MSGTKDPPDVDLFDESEEIYDLDRVVLVTEDGDELDYVVLAVIEHEGEDYALLTTEEQLEDEESEALEVHLFHYQVDDEGLEIYGPIEDDATYEAVAAFCSTLMDGGLEE